METLRVNATVEELQKRIEQHQTALKLMPKGKVRDRLLEDVARLQSILDLKQIPAVPE